MLHVVPTFLLHGLWAWLGGVGGVARESSVGRSYYSEEQASAVLLRVPDMVKGKLGRAAQPA